MSGCVAIDYEPRPGAVASILSVVNLEGFTLVTIRVIPCADGKRETLTLNINAESRLDWVQLEAKLRQLDGILDVIHCSEFQRSTEPTDETGRPLQREASNHSRASATVSNT